MALGLAEENTSQEELGLSPDLSRLSRGTLELLQHGLRGKHWSRDEERMEVCAELLRAGYSADEIWTVMTHPNNGISREFFEEDGEEAETRLERTISEAYARTERAQSGYG